ncbi:MAG: substrate-binding domain-containing protein [Treponema sp.]|jgi:ABC-type sugar transport system substrate-binding protein|nr:substrate-binding domain-containing protein [Treponema sp.]
MGQLSNRLKFFPLALCALVFVLLVGWTLGELRTIGTTINIPRNTTPIEYQFALLIPAMDYDLFYTRFCGGMKEIAEREHAVLEVYEYPEGERDEIRRLLRLILNTNPDGVVFSIPYDPAYEEYFKAFADHNIPLVTLEYDAVCRDAHVGSNPFELGRLAGEAVISLNSGGSAAVLLSGGDTSFIQGFRQVLMDNGTIGIGMIRSYEDTTASGEEFIREILVSRDNITVAVFTGSREAEGAAQALIEYGRVGTPLIIASEDNPEIRRLMEMGVISATVVRNPENAGRAAIQALRALSRNERTNAYVDPGSSIVWAETLKQGRRP